MRRQLAEADATEETPSSDTGCAASLWRLPSSSSGVGNWRVFYRVHGEEVQIVLIGEKRGERLFIDGKSFIL